MLYRSLRHIIALAIITLAPQGCNAEPVSPPPSDSSGEGVVYDYAVYAGGCFWCIEADLEKLNGVGDVVSGYAGGESPNPTYRNHKGHLEVVRAPFDPSVISYRELTDAFLRNIDPLDDGGQFCDRGYSYTTAIFYAGDEQKADAEAAITAAEEALNQEIVTPIRALDQFYRAEDYHQDYYLKNPNRYQFYRRGCGRDARVEAVWGNDQ